MRDDNPEDTKVVKKMFDEMSRNYDDLEKTLEGRLSRELEYENLLKIYLNKDRHTRILDAGGGTGRMTLPLAKSGYEVTLCDLSPGMLAVAREKLKEEGLADKVEIKEADLTSLPFNDEVFDFVVCLHGAFCIANSQMVAKELTRVMKNRAMIMVDSLSRYWAVTHELNANLKLAHELAKSEKNHAYHAFGDWQRVFSPEEFKAIFERNGIKVINMHGSFYHLLELLPDEILQKRQWDDDFLSHLMGIMMQLRDTPSVIGMARELILVGEKNSK